MSINQPITDIIKSLEMILLNPNIRKSLNILSNILSDDFMEFGSSGRIYKKKDVIDALKLESKQEIFMQDFKVKIIKEDLVLASYTAIKIDDEKNIETKSLRSSIWKKTKNGWQIILHQGTTCK